MSNSLARLPLAGTYCELRSIPAKSAVGPYCVHDLPIEHINEKLLHYLWSEQAFRNFILETVNREKISITFPGFWNTKDGPDFTQAVINIDDKVISGDVEIHLYSSDWYRHNHHQDKRYDNVILHIAGWTDDKDSYVLTTTNKKIPQLILTPLLEKEFEEIDRFLDITGYTKRNARFGGIGPCSQFCLNASFYSQVRKFMEMAGEARLYYKSEIFRQRKITSSYDEIMYQGIMEALGYQHNSLQFCELAKMLPLDLLKKVLLLHIVPEEEKPLLLQSLFLYQAKLVPIVVTKEFDKSTMRYLVKLSQLYEKLLSAIGSLETKKLNWNFKGTRPINHPTRRIAGMSYLLSNCLPDRTTGQAGLSIGLFQQIQHHYLDKRIIFSSFNPTAKDEYWLTHTTFGGKQLSKPAALVGKGLFQIIEINIFIPLVFLYAHETDNHQLITSIIQGFKTYPKLPDNHITSLMNYRLFADKTKVIRKFVQTAFYQQALIQIYRDFCAKGFEGCQSCGLLKWLNRSICDNPKGAINS